MSFADVVFLNYYGQDARHLFKRLPLRNKISHRRPCNRVYIIGKGERGEKSIHELDNKNIIATAGCGSTFAGTHFFLTGKYPCIN